MPPLMLKLSQLQPEQVDYVSVAFGLTQKLYTFWRRADYQIVHLRQV